MHLQWRTNFDRNEPDLPPIGNGGIGGFGNGMLECLLTPIRTLPNSPARKPASVWLEF